MTRNITTMKKKVEYLEAVWPSFKNICNEKKKASDVVPRLTGVAYKDEVNQSQ